MAVRYRGGGRHGRCTLAQAGVAVAAPFTTISVKTERRGRERDGASAFAVPFGTQPTIEGPIRDGGGP